MLLIYDNRSITKSCWNSVCPFYRYVGCVDLKCSFNKIENFTLGLFRGFVLGVVYVIELGVVLPTKRFEFLLFFNVIRKGVSTDCNLSVSLKP